MKKLDILGSEVMTPDGKGSITSLHTNKVLVGLNKIEFKQKMVGLPDTISTMHYYYDYEDVNDEITNGKISLLTKDDDDEALQPIVDALNDSGCKFYQDDWFEFENKILKEEITRLKFMINNGLGWKDMENDISPMHEL